MRRLLYGMRLAVASPARTPRKAVVLGRLLGIAFVVCFGTGLVSHFLQHPAAWMMFPSRPVAFYQVNQAIHVLTGTLCIPLLLGKLWVVYPDLFQTPPVKSLPNLLERASIALFVGASIVQLAIGLLNIYQFLPLPFYFLQVHFALSFVIIGSLALHIAVKLPIISRYWRKPDSVDEGDLSVPLPPAPVEESAPRRGLTGKVLAYIDATPTAPARVSRRALLAGVGVTSVVLAVLTAGQTVTALDGANLFGPRKKGTGPQGLLVNRTSAQAKVKDTARDPAWRLKLANGDQELELSLADLQAMAQTEVTLPIACVEGWSQSATWRGVRVKELVALVGAPAGATLAFASLEQRGPYRATRMDPEYVQDDLTIVALELDGEPLHLEHGFPARVMAPGRPGVLQTKWLASIEVAR